MNTENQANRFDAIVVGGSYAGLSAALQLARARRRVLVIDKGERRNRFADTSHGFLGQDGSSPATIANVGRMELLAYRNVQWLNSAAADAMHEKEGFTVVEEKGREYHARRIVIATGIVDELPAIEGLAQRWGKSVFHCPYCHGYELNNGRIGVIAVNALSMHHALMLPDWGKVTLFTNEAFTPDSEQMQQLENRGVEVESERVAAIVDKSSVALADGKVIEMDGLFTMSKTHMACPLPQRLGCEFEEGPMGRFIRTGPTKETTVPGVFACGDAARGAGNVALAVGDGAMAGVATHQSLIFSSEV